MTLALALDAVESVADALCISGTFTPSGGSATSVRVLPLDADDRMQLAELGARKPGWVFWVPQADLPTKPKAGALVVDGKTYVLKSVDEIAQRGMWAFDCDRTV